MPFPRASTVNADVRALADLFKTITIGEVVSYDTMSGLLGAPIQARPWLKFDALTLANKEAGCIFGNVRSVGYIRLPGHDAHLLGHAWRRRVRRSARRTRATISRAIEATNDLSPEAGRKAYAEINTLGLVEHLTKDQTAATMVEIGRPAPVAQVMRAALAGLGVV